LRDKKTIITSFILAVILGLQLSSALIVENLAQGTEYDITLWISDSEEKVAFRDLNVTVYDSDKNFVASRSSNQSGYAALRLKGGSYFVSVQKGNRLVGYQEINVTKPEIFVIRTWAYDINVTCVDLENKPLEDHTVLLYDHLIFYAPKNFTTVANKTDILVNWTRTDENGTAAFNEVWNGTYVIRVASGEVIGEHLLDLQASESITIIGNKTYMALTFLTASGEPLENARVFIQNSAGRLVFRDRTDKDGYVLHEGVYVDTGYTVFVEWVDTQVWVGTLNLRQVRETTVRCSVYRLSIRFVDQFGNALPRADVTLRKFVSGRYAPGQPIKLVTDDTGSVSSLLPSGSYEVSCVYGIYTGFITITLASDYSGTVNCNVNSNLWILSSLATVPLIGLTVLMERRRLRKPLVIRRYRNMLLKLESMYNSGLVEYKVYRKLRSEYEAKLMELGGRAMG